MKETARVVQLSAFRLPFDIRPTLSEALMVARA